MFRPSVLLPSLLAALSILPLAHAGDARPQVLTAPTALFDPDYDPSLTPPDEWLDALARRLQEVPDAPVTLRAHHDHTAGSQVALQRAGEYANAMRRALVERGVNPKRLTLEVAGDAERLWDLFCSGRHGSELVACLSPMRRIEIVIFPRPD